MTDHVNSASDRRVENNVVRHEYRILTDEEKVAMRDLKDLGLAFITRVNSLGKSRELSLAVTKVEEAVMWAVKHVTS